MKFLNHWSIKFLGTLALSFTLLSGCDDPKVGGGATDNPNQLAGIVQDNSGKPVSGAKLKVYSRSNTNLPVTPLTYEAIDSTTTGTDGKYTLKLNNGRFAINVVSKDSSVNKYIPNMVLDNDTIVEMDPIILEQAAVVKGRLVSQGVEFASVKLSGSPFSTPIASNGSFEFKTLAAGEYGVLSFFSEAGKTDTNYTLNLSRVIAAGDTLDLGEINFDPNVIMLDDFEEIDAKLMTNTLWGGGWWYPGQYPNGALLYPTSAQDITEAIKTEKENGNKYLSMKTVIPKTEEYGYGIIGFNIGHGAIHVNAESVDSSEAPAKRYFDFSKVQRVCFSARGSGDIWVQLGSKGFHDLGSTEFFRLNQVSLIPEWKEHCLELDTVLPPENSSDQTKKMVWKEERTQIYAIDFMCLSDCQLDVDDIYLKGANIEDL